MGEQNISYGGCLGHYTTMQSLICVLCHDIANLKVLFNSRLSLTILEDIIYRGLTFIVLIKLSIFLKKLKGLDI